MNPALFGSSGTTGIKRTGVVRPVGKCLMDDTGFFHPLGMTFMWALYGWKFERERLKKNLQFLAPYGLDYLRILGAVGWSGREINPQWPDYKQILGEFIDYAYDVCGLRIQITVTGGGINQGKELEHCQLIINVINHGRQHKVILVECANEASQNGPSVVVLTQMGRLFHRSIPNLVALSVQDAEIIMASSDAGADTLIFHTEREEGDYKWRQVRQGWDFKDAKLVVSNNEPPGPNSSVGTNNSPLQLAMMRLTGIISGSALYVLHIGDMVAGVVDRSHNRQANLWEVDNIDAIIKAVRGIDNMIPLGVEDWAKANNSWPNHPLTTREFWEGTEGSGVNRNYCATNGTQFIIVENGVKNKSICTAQRDLIVDVYSPFNGKLFTKHMAKGDLLELGGRADSMTAYVLKGQYT